MARTSRSGGLDVGEGSECGRVEGIDLSGETEEKRGAESR